MLKKFVAICYLIFITIVIGNEFITIWQEDKFVAVVSFSVCFIALFVNKQYVLINIKRPAKRNKVINNKIEESAVPYYRDIPCENDLFKAHYIACQYKIIEDETNLIGAIILKWIKEKKVSVLDIKKGGIKLTENYVEMEWENHREYQLYRMLYLASTDGVLEKRELRRWCNSKPRTLYMWFKNVLKDEEKNLIKNGKLKYKFFIYTETKELYDEAIKLCGLKKYLNDFTLIDNREIKELIIYDDYLIMAQLLGVADKTIESFYPYIF